jgi:hypothetical protein
MVNHCNKLSKLILIIAFLLGPFTCVPQENRNLPLIENGCEFFISASAGAQMSGIKSEDFVKSNYSPLLNVTAGRWFVPYLALQVGYKGYYFNTISDDLKRNYDFYYGEAALNVIELLAHNDTPMRWDVNVHAGAGYFYNHYYKRPNVCANMGLQQRYRITPRWYATFDISAIMGWDIYQGDEDILPGITFGMSFIF